MEVKMKKNEKCRILFVKRTLILLSLILMYGQILFATNIPRPEHYKVINGNPLDPVWSIYFEQGSLNIGDEIVVYDGEILVGTGIVISDNILDNVIPVFSNLYKSGNYPVFKVWTKNENTEYLLTGFYYLNPYGDAYIEGVFPQEDGEYSLLSFSSAEVSDEGADHSSLSIFPNPSDGIFNISFDKVNGDLQCKVMDLRGKDYCNFEFSGIKESAIKQLDLKELPAGVYFICISGKDCYQVRKIVIQ